MEVCTIIGIVLIISFLIASGILGLIIGLITPVSPQIGAIVLPIVAFITSLIYGSEIAMLLIRIFNISMCQ